MVNTASSQCGVAVFSSHLCTFSPRTSFHPLLPTLLPVITHIHRNPLKIVSQPLWISISCYAWIKASLISDFSQNKCGQCHFITVNEDRDSSLDGVPESPSNYASSGSEEESVTRWVQEHTLSRSPVTHTFSSQTGDVLGLWEESVNLRVTSELPLTVRVWHTVLVCVCISASRRDMLTLSAFTLYSNNITL